MDSRVGKLSYYLWKNSLEPLTLSALTVGAGAVVFAGFGEILDHAPYFSHALPEAISYIKGGVPPYGNLDKFGVLSGVLIGGLVRYRIPLGIRDSRRDSDND